ncbi:ABC transporter permease [Pseudomonas sp. QE6]|uniref:ABC transporter permease n=1 Tax=Pseudomonas sp. QE6 TaxID=3242491 RepID=UPI0035281432
MRPWRSRVGQPWMLVSALVISALTLLPLFCVVAEGFQGGMPLIAKLVFRPRVAELLYSTATLVVLTIPLCVVHGVAMAWLTERTTLPGRRLLSLLVVAPLAIPAFVHSYAWTSLVPSIHGLFPAVLISVIAYSPFIYLPASAALRRLDPVLEDVAQSLGDAPSRVFLRVVLPQLRIPIWGGSLLVGLHLLAEYGLYALIRFDTFTTAIFDQYQSSFSGPSANLLAGVLALGCLMMLTLESATRGAARYARLGAGSPRSPQLHSLPTGVSVLVLILCAGFTAASLGVPLVTLEKWLAAGGTAVWRSSELLICLGQTLLLGAAGALLTTIAAVPIAWISVRAPSRFQRWLEGSNYVASALPGIVIALALVSVTIRFARPLYQTVFTVLLAYMLMFLPRALVSLRAGLAQVPVELENIARSLGRTPAQAVWGVTIRFAAPGAAAGVALVFLAVVNELTATLLLSPSGTSTLATAFWAKTSEIDYAAAAPYALLMILLSLPLTGILYHQSKRVAGR